MQWSTVAWWRWRLAQALGRNPLVRASDRIEVAVMAVAVAVSLAAMPIAGAIGTAVHDEQSRVYAAERQDRQRVAAATTEDSAASPKGPDAVVQARWQVGDVENAGAYTWDSPAKDGTSTDIWVDRQGRHVSAPAPSWQAGVDAVGAAAGFWLSVTAAAALLIALVRRCLKHARYAGWNRDIASLVHDGGRTNRHR
jgi:Flp pilus assembly protein TadB